MIEVLKRLVPTTQKEIDRHYYYCFGDGQVEIKNAGSTVVYIVKGERVNDYLQKKYGKDAQHHDGDLKLRSLNIFDEKWTSKYGYPAVKSSLKSDGLAFPGSFSCINHASAVRGYGHIASIGSDYIDVHEGRGKKRLHLGACSRIETVLDTPKPGRGIYYEAVPSSADGYNLMAATCV